nr:MAG TPA: hypothetical protein [Caudoviricetes sp.]
MSRLRIESAPSSLSPLLSRLVLAPLPFVCCRVCCGLWNGGVCRRAWSLRLSSLSPSLPPLSLLLVVFGVVRAQLCEHARYPRTPLRLSCYFFPFLSTHRLSSCPAFLLLEWRCVIHHVSVCLVGMTAMGSLSRSSSFF